MRPRATRSFSTALLALALATVAPVALPASASSTPRLQLLTEPNAGIGPIDALFAGARHSVDLELYELADPHLEAILAADAARGVRVRVLLDRKYEQARNAAAFSYLRAHKVDVAWASDPGIDLTHEKAAVIDGATALVMTLNLVATEYATTRDFAVVDRDRRDVAAIESVFAADWRAVAIAPSTGADLLWSPGAEPALVRIIDGARHSLLVENEEMADPSITAPLEAAARRGVHVEIVMTASPSLDAAFAALAAAGVALHTEASPASLYIHAKAIVADAGTSDARAFVGSQNFSVASLVHNRELGIVTSAPAIVNGLATAIDADFETASPWRR